MDEYKIKSNETVSILPLSDLHVGSSQFNEEFFDEWIKMARRTKNKRIYCLGDMIEFGAKRVGDSAFNQCINPNDQMDFVVDKLSEFKDDIVYFTNGNHCDRGSNEFNLNLAKLMADRLDVKFASGFIDAFKVNDKVFTVNGSHGNTTNARRDLSIGGLIRAVNGIEADIYLRGHNHRLLNYYDFVNTSNGLKKKFYCYTGSFLNYKGSYAEKNGLNPLPAGYMIINIPINYNIKITEVYDDCGGV